MREVEKINFCVEDPAGRTVSVILVQYPELTLASGIVLDTIFAAGTPLAIREPLVDVDADSHGNLGIAHCTIKSPSDLVFLKSSDPILQNTTWAHPLPPNAPSQKTVAEWKLCGNNHFSNGEYIAAAVAYTRGLESDPSAYILLLNRSAAYVRLEYFVAAIVDATAVLDVENLSRDHKMKALYRTAQAEYGMGRYDAALTTFTRCVEIVPEYRDIDGWIARCHERVRESQTGVYDWTRVYKEVQTVGNKVDVSEFIGPIQVGISACGGGRGVVTTRAVKVGELLVSVIPPNPVDSRNLDICQ